MHLDECFQLAFSQPPNTINKLQENESITNSAHSNDNLSFLRDEDNSSSIQSHNYDDDKVKDRRRSSGSIYSMLQCIVSEWGTKSQTNFYIPSQHYAGYTYLFDDNENNNGRLDVHYVQNHYSGSINQQHHQHHSAQKSPKFVHAEDSPNNLHSHHYDVYMLGNLTQQHIMHSSSINMTTLTSSNNFMYNTTSHHTRSNSLSSPPIMMTIPYIHPQLEIPVPPLYLPTYFGILCWTYALAGMVILSLPPKWCLYGGGGFVTDSRKKEKKYRRHWFPVRLYGWALILCQSPCSFLADYVHMTNISAWHTIDRFLACSMMCLELAKLITMSVYTRPYIYMLNLTSVGLAMFCFLQSQKSQQALDEDGFIFWHCGWHCYPIAACIIHITDHYLNRKWGEYYPFDECDTEDTREEELTKQTSCTNRPSLRRSRRLAGKAPTSM